MEKEEKTYPTANIANMGSGGLAPLSQKQTPFRDQKSPTYLGLAFLVLCACFVDGMKWGLTEVSQKPTEAPQKTPN